MCFAYSVRVHFRGHREKIKAFILFSEENSYSPHVIVTKWQVAGVQFNFKIFINFVDIFQIVT